VLGEIASVLFLTSLFAAMLSFHQAVGRYMYALGRELVIPRSLGRTYRRTGSPRNASVVQSVIGLVVIGVYAWAGWDPVVQLFFWLGTTGGFGVLLLLAATSVAIIVFFARERRGRESVWRTTVAPGLAFVALVYMAYSGVANYAILLSVEPGSPVSWILPGAYAIAAAAGILYGLWLRSAQPRIYQGIGLGEDSRAGQDGARTRA
jgi:amino acid transporter